MKNFIALVIGCFFNYKSVAQELFVFTEPASNMAAKSIGVRAMNVLGTGNNDNQSTYHLMPEVMVGVNRKFMFHLQAVLSNTENKFSAEGMGLYAKYRFLSNDDVHKHFRMAAFAKASYNSAVVHQQEIETLLHNSGFKAGIIGTQLLHKVAISSSIALEQAVYNNKPSDNFWQPNQALSFSLSVGKLMLPKTYTNYNQTNFNLMIELLGQQIIGDGKSYLDIAPSMQFIIKSIARIDFGYRVELLGNMSRTSFNQYVIKLEYNFFSAF